MRHLPKGAPHRSEAECASGACAARAERCQDCRRARRSAAEREKRHPKDSAAAQAGAEASEECRVPEGTDSAARSGDGSVAIVSQNREMEKAQEASEESTTVLRKKGAFHHGPPPLLRVHIRGQHQRGPNLPESFSVLNCATRRHVTANSQSGKNACRPQLRQNNAFLTVFVLSEQSRTFVSF